MVFVEINGYFVLVGYGFVVIGLVIGVGIVVGKMIEGVVCQFELVGCLQVFMWIGIVFIEVFVFVGIVVGFIFFL